MSKYLIYTVKEDNIMEPKITWRNNLRAAFTQAVAGISEMLGIEKSGVRERMFIDLEVKNPYGVECRYVEEGKEYPLCYSYVLDYDASIADNKCLKLKKEEEEKTYAVVRFEGIHEKNDNTGGIDVCVPMIGGLEACKDKMWRVGKWECNNYEGEKWKRSKDHMKISFYDSYEDELWMVVEAEDGK